MNVGRLLSQKAKTDEWYTKKETVELIVPFLRVKKYKRIYCPFDKKESNFVTVLKEHGFEVYFSHIETGTDFFTIPICDFHNYDAVVSNPPFSCRTEVLQTLFRANIPFAMILNFTGLFDNSTRFDLFANNTFELLVPRGRIQYFNANHEKSHSLFQSVFVCHDILPKQITFAEGYHETTRNR